MASLYSTDRVVVADRRLRELIRIRQIFVPELIIRLHAMLYTSRVKIPEYVLSPRIIQAHESDYCVLRNLKETLTLTNIVADARYRLYDDFGDQRGRQLSDYMAAVRHAVLGGLESGGSDPFHILNL